MSRDATDLAAGLEPGGSLYALRRLRPEFVGGTETCRAVVLAPSNEHGLSPSLRAALGARMARANNDLELTAQYDGLTSAGHRALATGATPDALREPEASMARHADLVTISPAKATAQDIERLAMAGLDNGQIVALSELIAFVNYQVRVVQGLRLMGAA